MVMTPPDNIQGRESQRMADQRQQMTEGAKHADDPTDHTPFWLPSKTVDEKAMDTGYWIWSIG